MLILLLYVYHNNYMSFDMWSNIQLLCVKEVIDLQDIFVDNPLKRLLIAYGFRRSYLTHSLTFILFELNDVIRYSPSHTNYYYFYIN